MERVIQGLHHITAITSDASTAVQFYTGVLGLRLVKKTVNFDDPSAYHLYFGDEKGTPGTVLTFFDWGTGIGRGRLGTGVTQHLAFTTKDTDSLLRWRDRLLRLRVPVEGPFDHMAFKSLYLRDPDGLGIEIATRRNGKGYSEATHHESLLFQWEPHVGKGVSETNLSAVNPDMRLEGLHHVTGVSADAARSESFYTGLLGFERVETGPGEIGKSRTLIFGRSDGAPGTMIFLLSEPNVPYGTVGIGTVHHIAFAVKNEEVQLEWRKKLSANHVNVTRVLDRKYFRSIYFREPNGLLLELATIPPGFTVDEPAERLGMSLALPEWLEAQRPVIEASLKPVSTAVLGS